MRQCGKVWSDFSPQRTTHPLCAGPNGFSSIARFLENAESGEQMGSISYDETHTRRYKLKSSRRLRSGRRARSPRAKTA